MHDCWLAVGELLTCQTHGSGEDGWAWWRNCLDSLLPRCTGDATVRRMSETLRRVAMGPGLGCMSPKWRRAQDTKRDAQATFRRPLGESLCAQARPAPGS
jgi:hypothetical protein